MIYKELRRLGLFVKFMLLTLAALDKGGNFLSQYICSGATLFACCADLGAIRESLMADEAASTWLDQVQKITSNGAEGGFI